jgi:hypothetical protein
MPARRNVDFHKEPGWTLSQLRQVTTFSTQEMSHEA